MSLPRVPKMEQRAHKTQALEALTHLRPLLRARRNRKKYLQNGFFSGLLKTKMEVDALETTTRAATASERNARYMLWSTIFAAASAVAALGSAIITMIRH